MKLRTLQTNKALHLYFKQVANSLNEIGVSLPVLIQGIEVDVSEDHIKTIFKAIAKTKLGKDSTTQLTNNDINTCFDEMTRHLSKFGVSVAFPDQTETEEYLESLQKMV